MASAKKNVVPAVENFTLELNAEEAGYLFDLLYRNVAGELTNGDGPLGKIRIALTDAGVSKDFVAVNKNGIYANLSRKQGLTEQGRKCICGNYNCPLDPYLDDEDDKDDESSMW